MAIQAQILNLFMDLQEKNNLTYLFISHDLGVVQHMCDDIGVMYLGRFAEVADKVSLFTVPRPSLHLFAAVGRPAGVAFSQGRPREAARRSPEPHRSQARLSVQHPLPLCRGRLPP